jgi:Protein of unknown function (DUF3568)
MNKSMALLSGALLLLGACKTSETKVEANSITKRYARPAPEVMSALTMALTSLDLRIEEDRHDALGGTMTAARANKDQVKVNVKSIDETSTQVTVAVGEGDRNLSDIIHSQIAKNLGTGTAKSSFYGGSRWEQVYDTSLARCIMAGERACEAGGFTVTNRDIHETVADMMARRGTSTVLLHFEAVPVPSVAQPGQAPPPVGGGTMPSDKRSQVKVSFVVGTSRTEDNEETLQRLRNEFDRLIRQQ